MTPPPMASPTARQSSTSSTSSAAGRWKRCESDQTTSACAVAAPSRAISHLTQSCVRFRTYIILCTSIVHIHLCGIRRPLAWRTGVLPRPRTPHGRPTSARTNSRRIQTKRSAGAPCSAAARATCASEFSGCLMISQVFPCAAAARRSARSSAGLGIISGMCSWAAGWLPSMCRSRLVPQWWNPMTMMVRTPQPETESARSRSHAAQSGSRGPAG